MIIYRKNNESIKEIYFPRVSTSFSIDKKLLLIIYQNSTQMKEEYEVEDYDVLYDYYRLNTEEFGLEDLELGEYEFHLFTYEMLGDERVLYECVSSSIVQVLQEEKNELINENQEKTEYYYEK